MSRPDAGSGTDAPARPPWWLCVLDPGGLVARPLGAGGPVIALCGSTLAFTAISLQAALDLSRAGAADSGSMAALVLRGALLGSVGVATVGLLAWLAVRATRSAATSAETIGRVALAYSSPLVYGIVGLLLNVALGWNTAVSCGVTGLLWALGPLFVALREIAGGRPALATGLASVGGAAMLLGWIWWGIGA